MKMPSNSTTAGTVVTDSQNPDRSLLDMPPGSSKMSENAAPGSGPAAASTSSSSNNLEAEADSSDEVKVYVEEEGDEDREQEVKPNALSDDKSILITESEQVRISLFCNKLCFKM